MNKEMKVICVNATPNNGKAIEIIEGHKYTVIMKETSPFGVEHFVLAETINAYATWRFIPCSDIDETKMIREKLTEKV